MIMYPRCINFKKEYLYFDKDDLNDLLCDIWIKRVCWNMDICGRADGPMKCDWTRAWPWQRLQLFA